VNNAIAMSRRQSFANLTNIDNPSIQSFRKAMANFPEAARELKWRSRIDRSTEARAID
jgi:hypothetical protein